MEGKGLQAPRDHARGFRFLRYPLLFALASGLALRLFILWLLPAPSQIVRFDDNDAPSYFEPALNVLRGKGYVLDNGAPTAKRPPGYAAAIVLCGGDPAKVLVAQLGAFLIGGILLWKIARASGLSKKAAGGVVLFFALYPEFALFDSLLLTESFFTLSLLSVIWLFLGLKAKGERAWTTGAALGIVGAAMAYLRPTGLFLFPVLLGLANLPWSRLRMPGKPLLVALLVFAAALAPWMVRNHKAFGVPVFCTNGGYNLYLGNRGFSLRGFSPDLDDLNPAGNEAERDRAYMAAAWKWQGEHWKSLPYLWTMKWLRLWFNAYDYRGKVNRLRIGLTLGRLLIFGAVLFSFRGWRKIDPLAARLILGALFLFTAMHVFVHSEARYLTPLLPLLAIPLAAARERKA